MKCFGEVAIFIQPEVPLSSCSQSISVQRRASGLFGKWKFPVRVHHHFTLIILLTKSPKVGSPGWGWWELQGGENLQLLLLGSVL